MRSAIVLAVAASAVAFVVPDDVMLEQLTFNDKKAPATHDVSGENWWEKVPSAEDIFSAVEGFADHAAAGVRHSLDSVLAALEDGGDEGHDQPRKPEPEHPHKPHRPGHKRPEHGDRSKTIYEIVHECEYTQKFAKLIDDDAYKAVADLLKDTNANYTLFVPTDSAFERLPHHRREHTHKDDAVWDLGEHKPPPEVVLAVLKYHLLPGLYPAGRVLASHTLPTFFKPHSLGGHPQRLRVSLGISGVNINVHARVVGVNYFAANGIVHAVDRVLVPPPRAGRLLQAIPTRFSTLSLALRNTGLDKAFVQMAKTSTGGTLFAPSNLAFERLGFRLNAYLFSERGTKALAAILKYHVIANETLYSDAYYGPEHHGAEAYPGRSGTVHIDLPTLLNGKTVGVDIKRYGALRFIRVNAFVGVSVKDVVARDGVVQIVDGVLIPPHPRRSQVDSEEQGEMTVEDLLERLEGLMDEDDRKEAMKDL
ncbi:hypothetical protein P8C59_009416 [Phyllachora maydis]|uniref:FAS1 domain-containing protein n=1 Tax=Phyllachora maydis TaxID=1825666 RepID=A0AAD9ICF8_9PEZI|nr:hypothetical protein P8C59_009416 [Phyllachora maydis]